MSKMIENGLIYLHFVSFELLMCLCFRASLSLHHILVSVIGIQIAGVLKISFSAIITTLWQACYPCVAACLPLGFD